MLSLRPAAPIDTPVLIAGRDAEFHRFLGPGSPDPSPVACIVVDDVVVGWIDFDHDPEHWWLADDEVNVGYCVFRAFRRRGFASGALELLMQHLGSHTEWNVASLLIRRDNAPSLGVARRAAFQRKDDIGDNAYWVRAVPRPP